MAVPWNDYEGDTEDGVKRFRAPFRFFRSSDDSSVEATLTLPADVIPEAGEPIAIEGRRYLVRQVTSHPIRASGSPLGAATVELLLDEAAG
jgi:hypothetical protein